ncbi:hypothetical protein [Dokdonella fugitiva]|jgi:hypothetical protein|uniref:Uncharacterized protein n=1 Tax=Dokdonella fugitiva TaxID=328517 RepID=A0A4V2S2W9_9GAMM|nr:hypothetical protein [Dokdonella fugitiva]TCO42090.1 hypothetical protein EV148_102449 [Dokdonella fugitiva]
MSAVFTPRPSSPAPDRAFEADLCIHIFTASAALVGVCLTVIGLIRIVVTTTKVGTIADDLLAGDATLFMVSCLLSYWALRARSARRMHRIEQAADAIFLVGLLLMTIACAVITFAML